MSDSSAVQDIDQYLIKIDHNFSDRDRIFGRFAYADDVAPRFGLLPLTDTDVQARARNFIFSHTHIFSPGTINEAKFVFNRRRSVSSSATLSETDFNQRFGFDSRQPGVPAITFTGLSGFGGGGVFDIPSTEFDVSDSSE